MPEGVTSSIVAQELGIAQRSVNRLADRGVISFELDERGYRIFDLPTVLAEYGEYRDKAAYVAEGINWNKERIKADTRIKRAQADILELEREEMMTNYHRAEYVEDAFNEMLLAIRETLLGLPDLIAPKVIAQSNTSEISQTIRHEVMAALETLASYEYQPGRFQNEPQRNEEGCRI